MRNITNLIEQQFPEFVRTEGPRFVEFVKAYYSWVDSVSIDLEGSSDIDTAPEEFIDRFKQDLIDAIPDSVAVDPVLLMKHIKELWQSKGTEASIALLFRILFDEDIEVYYPRESILRASAGKWVQETSVRISQPFVGDVLLLDGELVFGRTSGASGRVERIVSSIERGVDVRELFLSGVVGEFISGEMLANADASIGGQVFNSVGPIAGLNVTAGGAYHQVGDNVDVEQTGGSLATAIVTEIDDRSAVNFTVVNGGSGYRVGSTLCIVSGGSGSGASFAVASIANTEPLMLNADSIEPLAAVSIGTVPTFVSGGGNTAPVLPALAAANASTPLVDALTFDNVTVGSIATITQTHGNGFRGSLPSARAIDAEVAAIKLPDGLGKFKGDNAVIGVSYAPGTITKARILTPGVAYSAIDPVSLVNTTRTDTDDGYAVPVINGVVRYPGRYADTTGWLSWNDRLQDNEFYQQFSYVVKTSQFVDIYRDVVKRTVHPAGAKMFGQLSISSTYSGPTASITSSSTQRIRNESDLVVPTASIDDVRRTWSYFSNKDYIKSVASITIDADPFGAGLLNFATSNSAFAIGDALTYDTYSHILTEANGYITILSGTNVINGVGTTFQTLFSPTANSSYVIIDNIPGDTPLVQYKVQSVTSNNSLVIDRTHNGPSITSGRLLVFEE